MKDILSTLLLIVGIGVAGMIGGYLLRDRHYQEQLAIATEQFNKQVKEANQAYANQKVIDDKELEALRQQATTAPPNPTIAIKKDTAKRIGAIK